jgi:hypothetical protein
MQENVDYELVPIEDQDNWQIRIKTGEFIETVFQFGALKVSQDGEHLNFNFEIVYSPMEDLTENNTDLQSTASEILLSILERAIEGVEE